MANFCPKCGVPLEENAKFCPSCGGAVQQPAPAQQPAAPVAVKKKSGGKTAAIVIICVLLVAALAVGAYFIFAAGRKGGFVGTWSLVQEGEDIDLGLDVNLETLYKFKGNGKLVVSSAGFEFEGKYKVDGDQVTFTISRPGGKLETIYTYSIEYNILTLTDEYGDEDTTFTFIRK